MKVTFTVDSGANIYSAKTVTFDLDTEKGVKQLGYTKEEWMELKEVEKQKIVTEWADNYIQIYFNEEE